MSPQSCFSEAFEIVRYNHEVLKITGENMRGYGKDFGSKTEGRRNHVDEYKYTDEDNIERLRVRFNAKGKTFNWGMNFYLMQYENQLVLTGKINDIVAYILFFLLYS
jgi:hypothetical protein